LQKSKGRNIKSENQEWEAALTTKDEAAIGQLLAKLIRDIEEWTNTLGAHDSSPLIDPEDGEKEVRGEFKLVDIEASDRAIEKVKEVISEIIHAKRKIPALPKEYLRRVAHNAIYDYARTDMSEDKGTAPSPPQKDDKDGDHDDTPDVRIFDPPLGKKRPKSGVLCASCGHPVNAEHNCQNPACGNCASYNPKNPRPPVEDRRNRRKQQDYGFYSPSPLLAGLLLFARHSVSIEALQECGREAKERLSREPGLVDEQVLTLYLWNHRQKKIAEKLHMKESNVSRSIATWRKLWNWDDEYIEKVRICSLYHNLVDVSREVKTKSSSCVMKQSGKREPSWNWVLVLPKSEPWLGMLKQEPVPQALCTLRWEKALLRRVAQDDRTSAWFATLPEDQDCALAQLVNALADMGWGLSPRKNRRAYPDDWDDATGYVGEDEEWSRVYSIAEIR